jgi:hypothetical protein
VRTRNISNARKCLITSLCLLAADPGISSLAFIWSVVRGSPTLSAVMLLVLLG